MQVQALGYVGVRATSLEDWASFGAGLLGLQLAEQTRSQLRFRMDDRKQRLLVAEDAGNGAAFFGWELADAAAVDAMAAKLERAGVKVQRGDAALCAQRAVAGLVWCEDPLGNRVELIHGAEVAAEPFVPGRPISGFRTGVLGMGHAVLWVPEIDPMLAFYRDVLGFKVSDYITQPFRAYFFHCNDRHHSLALIENPQPKLHHLMLETFQLDDVGQAYDIAQDQPGRVATTLGRHVNDYMTSFYNYSPSGFLMEYGWGGRTIQQQGWTPSEVTSGPSLWGHDRDWVSPEQRLAGKEMRMAAARRGERVPVQVLPGTHELRQGECLWWDQAVRGAAE